METLSSNLWACTPVRAHVKVGNFWLEFPTFMFLAGIFNGWTFWVSFSFEPSLSLWTLKCSSWCVAHDFIFAWWLFWVWKSNLTVQAGGNLLLSFHSFIFAWKDWLSFFRQFFWCLSIHSPCSDARESWKLFGLSFQLLSKTCVFNRLKSEIQQQSIFFVFGSLLTCENLQILHVNSTNPHETCRKLFILVLVWNKSFNFFCCFFLNFDSSLLPIRLETWFLVLFSFTEVFYFCHFLHKTLPFFNSFLVSGTVFFDLAPFFVSQVSTLFVPCSKLEARRL